MDGSFEQLPKILQAVTPPADIQHHAPMQEPVQDRRRQRFVPREDPRPVLQLLFVEIAVLPRQYW
jgi:hypothetical protein